MTKIIPKDMELPDLLWARNREGNWRGLIGGFVVVEIDDCSDANKDGRPVVQRFWKVKFRGQANLQHPTYYLNVEEAKAFADGYLAAAGPLYIDGVV